MDSTPLTAVPESHADDNPDPVSVSMDTNHDFDASTLPPMDNEPSATHNANTTPSIP
jgi:hypothetical protein